MNDLRRRFRRRFALISTAVTIVAACGATVLIAETMLSLGTRIGEMRHQETGRDFYATAERGIEALRQARSAGPEALRRHPETERLTELAKTYSRVTRMVRIAVHDRDGLTLFSTAPAEIGTFAGRKREFEAARNGGTASIRHEIPAFANVDGQVSDRLVVESYVSVQDSAGRPAVVSVYSDTKGYYSLVRGQLMLLVAAIVGALFAVLGMLIFYVGRDRVLAEQQAKNTELTETVRLAEESSRLKSRFVASMGHELRTPLNAIIGFSEAMKAGVFGPMGSPKYADYADTIHTSGRHLLAVVDDILDMARIEGGKTAINETVFPLRAALLHCAEVIAVEAGRQGHGFSANIPETLPDLRGDEAKIKQIVLNLLANAMRYTPRGGQVTLAAEPCAGGVAVTVSDTGIGIPSDQLSRVFEPFRQVENAKVRKSGGLGLGLNIAKTFAELHEGELTLASQIGRGTTARLLLPAKRLVNGAPALLSAAA